MKFILSDNLGCRLSCQYQHFLTIAIDMKLT